MGHDGTLGYALLRWYDRHRRMMPWRALPGQLAEPYAVWISEIMLQQTTVATVRGYFERFMARFPTAAVLAAADEGAVMEAWAGLGYYARARNMHACAKQVVALGGFPRDLERLRALPGIGVYTAGAIASIAFGVPVVPVDGNVERVVSRLFNIGEAFPGGRRRVVAAAAALGDDGDARGRAADFTQALFDLGATVCTPRRPVCGICPWMERCEGRRGGNPEALPNKPARAVRPVRYGAQFWLEDAGGKVLLRRRPARGLLGGMMELPGTAWRDAAWREAEAVAAAPQGAAWRRLGGVAHGFTHFKLELDVYAARVPGIVAAGELHDVEALDGVALPTVMRRCVALGRASRL